MNVMAILTEGLPININGGTVFLLLLMLLVISFGALMVFYLWRNKRRRRLERDYYADPRTVARRKAWSD